MDSVIRGLAVYFFLFVVFRVAGKRMLSQMTTFDFVLLLIISEAVQQAMIDTDNSVTNAFLLVITLVGLDVALSVIKQRSKRIAGLLDPTPVVIVEDGHVHRDRLSKERIDEAEILAAAREHQGLERLDQIKYAVVERDGHVSIVPKTAG